MGISCEIYCDWSITTVHPGKDMQKKIQVVEDYR